MLHLDWLLVKFGLKGTGRTVGPLDEGVNAASLDFLFILFLFIHRYMMGALVSPL